MMDSNNAGLSKSKPNLCLLPSSLSSLNPLQYLRRQSSMSHLLHQYQLPRRQSLHSKLKQSPSQPELSGLSSSVYNISDQPLAHAGVLYLVGPVCDDTTMPVISSILELNGQAAEDKPEAIQLVVNSTGGSGSACFHLIDVMKSSKIPIRTIGMGNVMSAGLLVLMAGEKGHRYGTTNTVFMSHQYAIGIDGKEHELQAAVVELSIHSAMMLNHYRKCTRKSESYIKKHLIPASDCYFTAADAKKHGVIDEVIDCY